MTQAIAWAAIEATKVAVQAMATAGSEAGVRQRSVAIIMGLSPRQPSFDCSAGDK